MTDGALLARATIALVAVSLLTAFVAGASTLIQVRFAGRQNEIAQEESLTGLVAELAHESRALIGANEEQRSAIKQARLADAEEAFALVGRIHDPTPAVDNYEIGLVFVEEDENSKAIVSFGRAGAATDSPHFRSAALIKDAELLFAVGGHKNVIRARLDASLAAHAYDKQPDTSNYVIDYNRAAGALFDANRDPANCPKALQAALRAIKAEETKLMEIRDLSNSRKSAESRCGTRRL